LDGIIDIDGVSVGFEEGLLVGNCDGFSEGEEDISVGIKEGFDEGLYDGSREGSTEYVG
jgi:hypothetical protein